MVVSLRSAVMTASLALAVTVLCSDRLAGQGGSGAAPKPKPGQAAVQATPGAGPVVVVETVRGTFAFETYPDEAPRTVEHVLRLVQRGFYNGLRVHRAVSGFVVQLGDPQTRDMTKREWWGRGDAAGSGRPVGVAEISKKHLHVRGAVAMAHSGNPVNADAQFYIVLSPQPKLNGKYAVFGRVIEGMDVVGTLQVADMIRKVSTRPSPEP